VRCYGPVLIVTGIVLQISLGLTNNISLHRYRQRPLEAVFFLLAIVSCYVQLVYYTSYLYPFYLSIFDKATSLRLANMFSLVCPLTPLLLPIPLPPCSLSVPLSFHLLAGCVCPLDPMFAHALRLPSAPHSPPPSTTCIKRCILFAVWFSRPSWDFCWTSWVSVSFME